MKAPNKDELIGGALLLQRSGEDLDADEAIVTLSMQPLSVFRPDYMYSPQEADSVFVGLLRTAGYFLLDKDEALPAIQSSPPMGEVMEFPPLPFPRIWIETRDEHGPTALDVFPAEDDDESDLKILGVGIIEREPGKLWDVLLPFEWSSDASEPEQFRVLGHSVTPVGFADESDRRAWYDQEPGGTDDPAARIIGLAITVAHLITAERVPTRQVAIGRQQRKRWERELKRPRTPQGPHIYFVDLKAAGETEYAGGGSRQFHVRWVVRGHYYKHPTGKFDIPGKGKCYWRKAYFKGPKGAPWKGRPIYVGGEGTPIE